jgi:hypothetical protein
VFIFCAESVYFRYADGTIISIAHMGDPAPGGGVFRHAFPEAINERGDVLIAGDLTETPGSINEIGACTFSPAISSWRYRVRVIRCQGAGTSRPPAA